MKSSRLLEQLIKIKDEINRQIPLAANRYEEFETCPKDADTFYTDEQDKLYFKHEKKLNQAFTAYSVNEELTKCFESYCREQGWSKPLQLTDAQYIRLMEYLLSQSRSIGQNIERSSRLISMNIDINQVLSYLHNNIETLTTNLIQGLESKIEHEEYRERIRLNLHLSELRKIEQTQLAANVQFALSEHLDKKNKELITKARYLMAGVYYERINTDTGYCGEHAAIALVKIFKKINLYEENVKTIEEVSVTYEEGDNHCFLILNRDQQSDLSNISQWGKDAILFDAWNKIVLYASDYPNLPLQYNSYPEGAKWTSTVFRPDDRSLVYELSRFDQLFAISGNDDTDQRHRVIREEYQLRALNKRNLGATRRLIKDLMKELWPDNFKLKVKVYLTTTGNDLVSVIPGSSHTIIAIHLGFLAKIRKEDGHTLHELRFALNSALLQIKYFGVGVTASLLSLEQVKIDREVIERLQCASAAIAFLRHLASFAKGKPEHLMIRPLDNNYIKRSDLVTPEERIKNILTMLAKNPEWEGENKPDYLSEQVITELNGVKPRRYFHKLHSLPDNVAKLAYLTGCLEKLRVELFPYECTSRPGIRAREFGRALKSLQIDLSDATQLEAVNKLINQAFESHIPSFEYIYESVHGETPKDGCKKLKPLGPFAKLQDGINAFVNAKALDEAEVAGTDLLLLIKSLRQHNHTTTTIEYANKDFLKQYRNEHDGAYPTGKDRYFCSKVMWHIAWKGFAAAQGEETPDKENKDYYPQVACPWDQHVNWVLQNGSKLIARTLMYLGITRDQRYWSVFSTEDFFEFHNEFFIPLLEYPGKNRKYCDSSAITVLNEQICLYMSRHHVVKTDMFNDTNTFEQAFIEFCDANAPALHNPGHTNRMLERNIDNDSIHFLLQQFLRVIKTGSKEEQQVVKGFFLGRADGRDLKHFLNGMYDKKHLGLFYLEWYYAQFIVYQRYKVESFDFFSGEEIMQFMLDCDVCPNNLSWQDFAKMHKVPFEQELTFECLEALLELLKCYTRYAIKSNFIDAYLYKNANHYIISSEAIRLVRLTRKHESFFKVRQLLGTYHWNPPNNLEDVSIEDIIYMYRFIDCLLSFPNNEKREQLGSLILSRIAAIQDNDAQIIAIESLLLSQAKHDITISDIRLRNLLIDLWVKANLIKFGKDNQSEEYYQKLRTVIQHIADNSAASDRVRILSKLADSIQAQWKVSELMGIIAEPDKFLVMNNTDKEVMAMTALAAVSRVIGKKKEHVHAFLDFLSRPIDISSVEQFAQYLHDNNLTDDILRAMKMTDAAGEREVHLALYTLYNSFWDRPLDERAIAIEYLLIPVSAVTTDEEIKTAYAESLVNVCERVFADLHTVGSDDEFASSFLRSYLEASEPHLRSFLLAGLLVASNQGEVEGKPVTVGKKLVMIAEHLGPAYVKIIQAIDSHPDTPAHIRADTHHAKSRANPPHRWNIWRMIMNVLPERDRHIISHVFELLGSASYNLGVKVKLRNGQIVVLSLLREFAERDAKRGFEHLAQSVQLNEHPRMLPLKAGGLSMISEAKAMSHIEMDHELSVRQYELALQLYGHRVQIGEYDVKVYPVRLLKSGYGYRFIELVPGVEFNDLPKETPAQIQFVRCVAKAVMCIEFINILRGCEFDSDRHGNQLRILADPATKKVNVGLYDFGEMTLTLPNHIHIRQFVGVIRDLFNARRRQRSADGFFDGIITTHIEMAQIVGEDTNYLMRIRKGLLALQDFQRHLTPVDLLEILLKVGASEEIHPTIREELALHQFKLKTAYHSLSLFNRVVSAPPQTISKLLHL